MRDPHGAVADRAAVADGPVVTSIIVAAEIWFGLERRPNDRLARQAGTVFAAVTILPFDGEADRSYGHLIADLERRGTPIGGNDLLIAAHALRWVRCW